MYIDVVGKQSTKGHVMGLDMYLYKKNRAGEPVEIGYWRKANAIHSWFVRECQAGVDECQETLVSSDKLLDLLAKVWDILSLADTHMPWKATAAKTLPSQAGFFFGSTDYDNYYLDNLRNTENILLKAIKETEPIYYQSSWKYKEGA